MDRTETVDSAFQQALRNKISHVWPVCDFDLPLVSKSFVEFLQFFSHTRKVTIIKSPFRGHAVV